MKQTRGREQDGVCKFVLLEFVIDGFVFMCLFEIWFSLR